LNFGHFILVSNFGFRASDLQPRYWQRHSQEFLTWTRGPSFGFKIRRGKKMGKGMDEAIQKLRDIQEKNLVGGGLKHIERQHSRNKLTGRERIEYLLDPGTFNELGSWTAGNPKRPLMGPSLGPAR
jgi:hypothetical protein